MRTQTGRIIGADFSSQIPAFRTVVGAEQCDEFAPF
jgi:hypothetical protein